MTAASAGPSVIWLAKFAKQLTVPPHAREAAGLKHIAGQERVVDRERAGINIANWINQAHDPTGAAQD